MPRYGNQSVASRWGAPLDSPPAIGQLITEDATWHLPPSDTAVALESKTATTHGGEHYRNDYCWVYTCRDGLIAQIRNFTDTLHADRLFGLDNKTPAAS